MSNKASESLAALDRTFLEWRDEAKVPLIVKVGEAAAAFEAKFGVQPNSLVLPMEADHGLVGTTVLGMATRCSAYVHPGVIRVGVEI